MVRCIATTSSDTRCNLRASRSCFCASHFKQMSKDKCGGSSRDIEWITEEMISLLPDSFTDDYSVVSALDSGAFSRVFRVRDVHTKKLYAMKINYVIYRDDKSYRSTQRRYIDDIISMYESEYHMLSRVLPPSRGVVRANDSVGLVTKKTKSYAMCFFLTDLQGDTLDQYFDKHNRKLPGPMLRSIASQLMSISEQLHKKNVLYLDYNLDNILFKSNGKDLVLIDFGLAVREGDWVDRSTYGHQVFSQINGNIGKAPSKLGDVQSICYILCYLSLGYLPWYRHFANPKKLASYKIALPRDEIFLSLPRWLQQLISHAYSYQTENDMPNYRQIHDIIGRSLG